MDPNPIQEHLPPPLLPKVESPRKPATAATSCGGDRLKRDEWSEGAVSTLLEAYESKWVLRNRAKLKGQDWEDVARNVSSRANWTKSPKTQTQCKNKIESMKKRYRSESAAAEGSTWPLYNRLDNLLRGTGGGGPPAQLVLPVVEVAVAQPSLMEATPVPTVPPEPGPPVVVEEGGRNSQESNGVDRTAKEEEGEGVRQSNQDTEKNHTIETDSSTPALYNTDKDKSKPKRAGIRQRKRRREGNWDGIAESIRWLAEAVVKAEQARMQTMRELEKMRVEAEAKRGEMDLKRTEIIANTQLEIARIFAAVAAKGVDSSLRIGRS